MLEKAFNWELTLADFDSNSLGRPLGKKRSSADNKKQLLADPMVSV